MALARTNLIGVQSGTAIGTASFTTGAATTTAGAFLVVMVFADAGAASTATNMTISDSKGNVYTSRITLDDGWGSGGATIRVWTAPVTSAGSTTWTADQGADSNDTYTVIVLQYTGADQTGFGATITKNTFGAFPNGAQSMILSGAPATTSEVVGLWGHDDVAGVTITPGASFTELFDLDISGHGGAEVEVVTGTVSTTVDLVDIDAGGSGNVNFAMGVAFEVKASASGSTGFDPRQAVMAWHPNSPFAFLRPSWPTQPTQTVVGPPPQTVTTRRRGWWQRARRQPQVPMQGSFCTWGTELAAWGAWQGPLNAQRTWEQILVCSGPPYVPPIATPRRRRGWPSGRHGQPGTPNQITQVTVTVPMPIETTRRRGATVRRRQQPQVPPAQVTVTVTYTPPIPRAQRRVGWLRSQRPQPRVHDDRSGTFPPPAPQTIRPATRRGFIARRRTQPVTPLTQTSVVVTFTPPIPRAQRRSGWTRRREQPAVTPMAVVVVPQIVEPRRRAGFIARRRQQPRAPFSVVVLVAPTYRPPIVRPAKRFGWWRKPRPVVTTLFSPAITTFPPGDLVVWLSKSGTTTTVLATTAVTSVTLGQSGTTTTVLDTTGHVMVTLGTV